MKHLWLVWSNLKRRKLRTFFTVASIIVAFLLYGLLIAAKQAFTAGIELSGQDRLVVQHKVSLIMSMPMSYLQRIASVPAAASRAREGVPHDRTAARASARTKPASSRRRRWLRA